MMEWIRKRRSEFSNLLQASNIKAPETYPALPVKAHKHTPPIVLRVGYDDTINDDNHRQFLDHGWRYGRDSALTQALDRMIYESVNAEGRWIALGVTLPIPNGYHVRAVQVAQHDNIDYYGNTVIGLFIPADLDLGMMERSSSLIGGPTAEMLTMAQFLAMRFESRIISIETATNGDVLILLSPWNPQYTLENYNARWQEEEITRVWQRGPLDDTNGKVANSEGS